MDSSNPLPSIDLLGRAAALLTLMTLVCRDLQRLRLLALAANAAFIAYGALARLMLVLALRLALQLALVPVNLWRLKQTLQPARRRDDPTLSLLRPAPDRAGSWRPRRSWTPRRYRRAETLRTVRMGAPGHDKNRSEPAFAEGPAIHP